jgi:mono/diheme cytochrome c family protein
MQLEKVCIGIAIGLLTSDVCLAADDSPAAATPSAITGKSPVEVVKDAPKGSLKNPYNPSQADKVAQGHELFMSYSCSGCHGGTGGGGMCPQLNGDVWFFGIDDDTLFRLVTLGSADLQKAGYQHLGAPSGIPMPPFGNLITSDDELWKILTWVRSIYKGDPKKKTW